MRDLVGPLHWFPVVTDPIVQLSLKVDQGPLSQMTLSQAAAGVEETGLSASLTASANVTSDIPCEKPEEWSSCLVRELTHSDKAKDCDFQQNLQNK